MNKLNTSVTVLEQDRRKVLSEILVDRYRDSIATDFFIDSEVDYIMGTMDGDLVMKAHPQGELTNADSLNEEMQGFEADIRTVFARMNYANQSINTQRKITESSLNEITNAINEANRKIVEVGEERRKSESKSILYDDFTDYRNRENDKKFNTDSLGNRLAEAFELRIHSVDDTLRLPMFNSENTLTNFAGMRTAELSIGKQVGSGLIRYRNPQTSIDKAIDTSMETYWSESILVDEPFRVNLGHEYYDTKFGATAELIISYYKATEVNEITLMPFVDFPMEVVSILIYDNDNFENPYELVSPTAIHRNIEDKEVISYQFQRVIAKKIVLLINQKHYVKRDMVVNVNDKSIVDAWLYAQGITEVPPDYIFKPLYHDLRKENPQWENVQKFLENRDVLTELSSYEDYDKDNNIMVSKFEYQYGLYNLAANFNEYSDVGIYVTKPLTNLNVQKIQLETVEDHPKMENISTNVTSIEYYVTEKDEPTASDWYSILPTNINTIRGEYMNVDFKDGDYQATLRFSVDKIIDVRGNGIRLIPKIEYKIVGRRVIIMNYNPSLIYTVDYKPLHTAYTVDFLDRVTTRVFDPKKNRYDETVTSQKTTNQIDLRTASNVVDLEKTPFWDRSIINRIEETSGNEEKSRTWNPTYIDNIYIPIEIQIILPTGESIMQQTDKFEKGSVFLTNKTDYHNLNHSLLEPFNGSNYQYRVERNQIKFNTTLPKGTRVLANYSFLTGPIRLKIIMRRSIIDEVGLTPVLHEYKIGLQSLV